ncbi:chemotaxis protein CheA [Proteocatella sphenisci]|uniref:chemotaxis protein CheA n=1 Tax=Proteocatella sphenisci TaxID=181070 RepID=UPI00048D7B27|nr:chemotaxis protein CheA [Proteocatella sphenisci]
MNNSIDSMLDMYLFETNSLLEQLEELFIGSEMEKNLSSNNIDEIFRIMHTIKGSSAMMEFTSLMEIAHRIEDLFFYIRENGMEKMSEANISELFDILFQSMDYFKSEVDKIQKGEPLSTNIDNFVTNINMFLDKIKNLGLEIKVEVAQEISRDSEEKSNSQSEELKRMCTLLVFFEEDSGMEHIRAFMMVTTLREAGLQFEYFPEDIETNREAASYILDRGFSIFFDSEEMANKAIAIIKNTGGIRSYEMKRIGTDEEKTDLAEIVQKEVSKDPHIEIINAKINNVPNKQSLISVNLSKLDKLMDLVGEIVITESMVTSSPDIQGLKLDNFLKSTRQLRKLTDELQDITMSLRMVPISGVFQKMNRVVRDMSKKLGKEVDFVIEGEDTEVDKSIVDSIGDPIMHIVRNSMDHGIEASREDRIREGKKAKGEILLSARHTGSEVIITISDDGRGIDTSRILEKARENGLLTKPENEYSQKEVISLMMMPGFSTNEEVTEFSGRGVGMDVVKKSIEALGGTITVTSDFGFGSCTTLKIPLTLAIVEGMETAVGKSIFTIPINNIRQCFRVTSEEIIHDISGREIVKRMDEFYPVVRIHELYSIDTQVKNIEDGILIWVESGDRSYCLFIDELIGEQQVVVKPLPSYLNSFNIKNSGIAGCTILGDGNISIILDILNVYTLANNE